MSETELSFDAQCPRCTGRTTRHRFRNRAETKERLIDGSLTLYCAWCEQSRQPTAAEQDFLLQWIFDTDEPAPLETAPSAEALKPGIMPHLEIDWPITLPATVDLAEVVTEHLTPIRSRANELLADPAELDRLLAHGADKAREIAAATLQDVYAKVGFLPYAGAR